MTTRPTIPALFLALLASAAGCSQDSDSYSLTCSVELSEVAPASGVAGDRVVAYGHPMTTHWDSAIYLDGDRATVLSVDREGCWACDTCREDNGCTACGDCDDCDADCSTDCIESVTFEVPDLGAGERDLRLVNAHGESNSVAFTVTGPAGDTGAGRDTAGGGDTANDTSGGGDTANDTSGGGGDTASDTAGGSDDTASDTAADTATGGDTATDSGS